jgi:hypothetical protein
MKYEVIINGFKWYVDNLNKTISETKDFKVSFLIRDICSKQERELINQQIKFGDAFVLSF